MDSGKEGVNPVLMNITGPWKEYQPRQALNQGPSVFKSCMLPSHTSLALYCRVQTAVIHS